MDAPTVFSQTHLNSLFDVRYLSFAIHPWALGRAALAVGDAETAADALRPLVDQASQRPLLYDDVLTALSRGGKPEDVLALYEAVRPPEPTQAVSDTVALAFLDQVTRGQGEGETGRVWEMGSKRIKVHRELEVYQMAFDAAVSSRSQKASRRGNLLSL